MSEIEKATGFKSLLDGVTAGPPSRPRTTQPSEKTTKPGNANRKPSNQKPKPVEDSSINDAANEFINLSLQLTDQNIQTIRTHAKESDLFKQIAFEELIVEGIKKIEGTKIPPKPRRKSPSSYNSYRQYSTRITKTLLDEIDEITLQGRNLNRSHVTRHILNQHNHD